MLSTATVAGIVTGTVGAGSASAATVKEQVDSAVTTLTRGTTIKTTAKEVASPGRALLVYRQIMNNGETMTRAGDFYNADQKLITAAVAYELAIEAVDGASGPVDNVGFALAYPGSKEVIETTKDGGKTRYPRERVSESLSKVKRTTWAYLFNNDQKKYANVYPTANDGPDWGNPVMPWEYFRQAATIVLSGGKTHTYDALTKAPAAKLPEADRYSDSLLFSEEDRKVVQELRAIIKAGQPGSVSGHGELTVEKAKGLLSMYQVDLGTQWFGHTIKAGKLQKALASDRDGTIKKYKEAAAQQQTNPDDKDAPKAARAADGFLVAKTVRSNDWRLRKSAKIDDNTIIGKVDAGEVLVFQFDYIRFSKSDDPAKLKKALVQTSAVALATSDGKYNVDLDDNKNEPIREANLWYYVVTADGKAGYLAAAAIK